MSWVTFNFTDDKTKAASRATAEELGLLALHDEFAPSTGFVVLVDAKTKAKLGKFGGRDSNEDIASAFDKALAAN